MNNRFKFRFWRKHYDGKFTLECADLMSIDGSADPYNVGEGDVYCYHPGETIIEQCTGLKDKNGKLIYEGDMLGGDVFDGVYVGYCNKCKSFELFTHGECMSCFDDLDWPLVVEEDGNLEVVGNIHENPELLK